MTQSPQTIPYSDLLTYAYEAGFSNTSAPIIAAIAMAESSGNPQAVGYNQNGTIDRGILQINNYYHAEVDDQCAYQPTCAFASAYTISNDGTDFSQWNTFTSGAWKQFIPANGSTATPGAPGSTVPVNAVPVSLQDTINQDTNTWSWLDNPMRIVKAVVGIVLVIGAIYILVSGSSSTDVSGDVPTGLKLSTLAKGLE